MGENTVRSVNSREYDLLLEVLKEARTSQGVGQHKLSALLGEAPLFIHKSESRIRRVDLVEFYRIAHALELDPRELFDHWLRKVEDLS